MAVEIEKTRAELQQENDKFRLIFEKAREGIAIIQDGYIRFCNPWFRSLSGYSDEEILSRDILPFVHPDDRDYVARYHQQRLDGEKMPERYAFRGITKQGAPLWLEVSGVQVEWEGKPATLNYFTDISEHQKTENLLKDTLKATNDGIWDYNTITDRFTYSERWAEMLGFQQGEVEGDRVSYEKSLHPDDLSPFRKVLADCLAGRSPHYAMEFRLKTKSGGYKWIYSRGRVVERDAAGNPLRLVGAHTDIHENRERLLEIQGLRERLQGMFDHLHIGIAIFEAVDEGEDFVILDFNQAAENITHTSRDQVVGCRILECFPMMPKSGVFSMLQEVWQTGEVRHIPPACYSEDICNGWCENRAYRLPSGEVVILFEDVSEKMLAEQAFRESEWQKEMILNSTSEVVAYYDLELKVVWANQAAATSVGLTRDEMVGKYCYELWLQRTESCPDCPAAEALRTRKEQTAEKLCPDGRHWFQRVFPVFDTSANIVGVVEFAQDITLQKRAEEDNKRLEAQFRQAQKLESIGRLAGGVAHDLNNLLSPILGYSELLLLDTVMDDPRRCSLEQILKASGRARDLVQQLLAFSRKQTLRFRSVDLNELIIGFEKLLRRTIRENIVIRLDLTRKLPRITGDTGQLEQVLMNLAVNAQDAMPDGGVLTFTTKKVVLDTTFTAEHQEAVPGEYLMLTVSDTGCGMKKEVLEQIFEPFFTTKDPSKGTGLGLSTVYGIIKQHGGNVLLQSTFGRGTDIRVYLPVTEGSVETEMAKPALASVLPGSESILLVEDNVPVRDLIAVFLRREGYAVAVAGAGREALDLLEKTGDVPDLVLTDVVMPGMTGEELAGQVALLYPEVKVLYMSGYNDDLIARHGVLDTGIHFIAKPFGMSELSAKIREVLKDGGECDSGEGV